MSKRTITFQTLNLKKKSNSGVENGDSSELPTCTKILLLY